MEQVRKQSKKRDAILRAIMETTEHPSADMLYSQLKPEYPDLSLGTVYRNLSVFLQDGDIVSVGSVAGQERYDGNTSPHAHFVCEGCSRVLDVELRDTMGGVYAEVERSTGGAVYSHSLTFTGLCDRCKKTKAAQ